MSLNVDTLWVGPTLQACYYPRLDINWDGHRVELKSDLTLSLLRARFIELNLPINVEVGLR